MLAIRDLKVGKRPALSYRQMEVLEWIAQFIVERGYPPAFREGMAHFGWTSCNAWNGHKVALIQKGYLQHEATKGRAITLLGVRWVPDPEPNKKARK